MFWSSAFHGNSHLTGLSETLRIKCPHIVFSYCWFDSCLSASCINHRTHMPISLWLLCSASRCHLMLPLSRRAFPLWRLQAACLAAFEIAFQTFLFGALTGHFSTAHCSLLTTQLCGRQPAGFPLNEVKKPRWYPAFHRKGFVLFPGESAPSDTVSWEQRNQRGGGGGQSGRTALSVWSGPIIIRLTHAAQIRWTF